MMIGMLILGYVVGCFSAMMVIGFMMGAYGPDTPEKQQQDIEEMKRIDRRV